MKMFLGPLAATVLCAGVFQTVHAARPASPVISSNDAEITWSSVPNADGYNVYRNDRYSATVQENSYTAPSSGEYTVTSFDKNANPTSYSDSSNALDMKVGSGDATPAPAPGSSARPAAPVIEVSGSKISWKAVPAATAYNLYKDNSYFKTTTTTSYTVGANGIYHVTAVNGDVNPTTYSVMSNAEKAASSPDSDTPSTPEIPDTPETPDTPEPPVPTQPPASSDLVYTTKFRDDFNGPTLSSKWSTPNWQAPSRDAKQSLQTCNQKDGVLSLEIKKVGNERLACYMSSKDSNFGPGSDNTMKIEYRADVSQVRARGAWFAGWMYVVSGGGASDDDRSTGMETDVFEAMPTWLGAYNTAAHDGPSSEKWIDPKNELNVDISKPGFHTYSVEWNKDCQVFSFDGKPVFTNRELISTTENHSIMLTMEAQTGTQWGMWDVGSFADNLSETTAIGKIDWVKVSEAPGFGSLCD